jgi:hypothetical protein
MAGEGRRNKPPPQRKHRHRHKLRLRLKHKHKHKRRLRLLQQQQLRANCLLPLSPFNPFSPLRHHPECPNIPAISHNPINQSSTPPQPTPTQSLMDPYIPLKWSTHGGTGWSIRVQAARTHQVLVTGSITAMDRGQVHPYWALIKKVERSHLGLMRGSPLAFL